MTLSNLAFKLAVFYHEGQTRENGVPYITHPIAVAEIAVESVGNLYSEEVIDIIKAIADLHDVLEDCEKKGASVQSLKESFKGFARADDVIDAVVCLTKVAGESYFVYLQRVKANEFARIVKLADLQHNLGDLPPGKRRDKYLLAQYFLLN